MLIEFERKAAGEFLHKVKAELRMMHTKAQIAEAEAQQDQAAAAGEQTSPPERMVMKVKIGEKVLVASDGHAAATVIKETTRGGVILSFFGPGPFPYFAVGGSVTLQLMDGVVIHGRVWKNRDGLLDVRKLMTRPG